MRSRLANLRTLTLPLGVPPEDSAIIIGPDVPSCLQARYSAMILFRPPGSNAGIGAKPYHYIAQRSDVTVQQNVERGFLVYDGDTVCGAIVYDLTTGFNSGAGAIRASWSQGALQAIGDATLLSAFEFSYFDCIVEWQAGSGLEIRSGAYIEIRDGSDFRLGLNGAALPEYDEILTSGTTTSVNYTATLTGSSSPGIAFVAPPSGIVVVHYASGSFNNTANTDCWTSTEVREGTTIGSGTVVAAAADDYAIRNKGPTTTDFQMASFRRVSNLTPGSPYNIRQMFKVGGGTGTFYRKLLYVDPVIVTGP